MRKFKLLLLLLVLALSFAARPVPTASASQCLCEILCWDNGLQYCRQDSCCNLYCCDKSDPSCELIC
jgi:hypothetical protein